MKINNFEDLKVWQESRTLVKEIYTLTVIEAFKKDFGLKEQLQRSAVSTMSNIAEGFERQNNKEFIKFLNYSKGSAGELRSQLYVAFDVGYIDEKEFNTAREHVLNISTQLSNFMKYLKKTIRK